MTGNAVKTLFALAAVGLLLTGCVTKPLGREDALTSTERTSMTCHDVDLELARTQAFVQRVNEESAKTDARDVSGFLLDWGIGNHMEHNDAVNSGLARQKQLEELQAQKNCPLSTAAR